MWNSLLDLFLSGVLVILLLSINSLTCVGAPVKQSEDNEGQDNSNDAVGDTNPEPDKVESTSRCWETENFTLVGGCSPCHPLATKILSDSCTETGFNQLVQCTESNQRVYKSCPRSRQSIEKSFWVFEGVIFSVGLVSCFVVYVRRRKLNREAAERVRKQISNSS